MGKVPSSGIVTGIRDNKDAGASKVTTGDGMAFEATSIREVIAAGGGVARDTGTKTSVATNLSTGGRGIRRHLLGPDDLDAGDWSDGAL